MNLFRRRAPTPADAGRARLMREQMGLPPSPLLEPRG